MEKITDLNVTGRLKGKFEALLGDAHQYIVAGILVRLGFVVSMVAVKGEPYDLLVYAFEKPGGREILLRCQTKASSKGSVNFTQKHNDLIIGVDMRTLDLYLIPTAFLANWGNSRAFSKLQPLKNKWDVLLNWNDDYLERLRRQLEPQRKVPNKP